MQPNDNNQLPPTLSERPARKRRRWPRRIALLAFATVILSALLVVLIGPARFNIPGLDDDDIIAFQRNERLIRRQLALPLPRQPDLAKLPERLSAAGLKLGDAIFMRIFKREFELEVWMKADQGFKLFATYPICMWSGKLGPKKREGDHQSPEGIYVVDRSSLNPNSSYHRSFNLGYPNAYDKSHGRTGSFLMVHGACASVGCYAMTDAQVDEIWRLVTAALDGGQKRFQVQAFPFRMTDRALNTRQSHPASKLWRELKTAHDMFEATRIPPVPHLCDQSYRFSPGDAGSVGDKVISNACPPAPQG